MPKDNARTRSKISKTFKRFRGIDERERERERERESSSLKLKHQPEAGWLRGNLARERGRIGAERKLLFPRGSFSNRLALKGVSRF